MIQQPRTSRRVALIAIYAALVLVAGYVLVYLPNIELVTCLLFVGGYSFGLATGSLIAGVVAAIFTYFNPIGSSIAFPLLFVFQIIFYVNVSILGGLLSRMRHRQQFPINPKTAFTLGVLGFGVTLVYDIGSTFAMYLPIVAWNWAAVWPFWLSGIVFSILHLASNPLVFALLLPVVTNAILEYYGLSLIS